jgi:MoaA/NifB/PqqE/SkfB family radical SAM enzyme
LYFIITEFIEVKDNIDFYEVWKTVKKISKYKRYYFSSLSVIDKYKIYFQNKSIVNRFLVILQNSYKYKIIWRIKFEKCLVSIKKFDKHKNINISITPRDIIGFNNILVNDKGLYFIDFECYEYGSIYLTLAELLYWLDEKDKKLLLCWFWDYDNEILNFFLDFIEIEKKYEKILEYKSSKKYKDHIICVNNVCNQKCIFCSAENRMEWNKLITLKDIFTQILEKGNYIQISWWEPLLDKNIYMILYFIRKNKKNCYIEFQTNGVYLLDNWNLDKLEKFNINLFNVNYPCHIKEINDRIVWVQWTFEKREFAMKEIIKRGLNLRINIIVNTLNYNILPQIVEHIHKNFQWLERIQFSFTKAMWAADRNEKVVPTYEESEEFFIKALALCKRYWIKWDVDHIPMCFLWYYYKNHVDYYKMINSEKWVFLEEKNYVDKCYSCEKKYFCSGYRRDYLLIYSET